MKNLDNLYEADGNQKAEGEDKKESNDNQLNSGKKDSFRRFLANQNLEDEKIKEEKEFY